jgi:hypothetical protein
MKCCFDCLGLVGIDVLVIKNKDDLVGRERVIFFNVRECLTTRVNLSAKMFRCSSSVSIAYL